MSWRIWFSSRALRNSAERTNAQFPSDKVESTQLPPETVPEVTKSNTHRESGAPIASGPTSQLQIPLVIGNPGLVFEPRPVDERFRTTPYRPDLSIDGWGTERFTLRAASLRGAQHRFNGAPRQDDFAIAYQRSPDRLIVAVADGVSSAKQSHLGATIAVRFAIQWLAEHLGVGPIALNWRALMHHAAWQLVEHAKVLFENSSLTPTQAEAQLATTLVCAVVEFPDPGRDATAHVAGVGDSGAWILKDREFARVSGGKSAQDSPITSSAVNGLPQVPSEVTPTVVVIPPGAVLLLGTDGFGDPLGSGSGDVGRAFCDGLATPPAMLDFAHILDFSRETFDDDRTLVAIWPTAVSTDRAPEQGR